MRNHQQSCCRLAPACRPKLSLLIWLGGLRAVVRHLLRRREGPGGGPRGHDECILVSCHCVSETRVRMHDGPAADVASKRRIVRVLRDAASRLSRPEGADGSERWCRLELLVSFVTIGHRDQRRSCRFGNRSGHSCVSVLPPPTRPMMVVTTLSREMRNEGYWTGLKA
jgi:hypothetical protein